MNKEPQKIKVTCKTEPDFNGEWLIYDILSELNDNLGCNADGNDAIEYLLFHVFDNAEDWVIETVCRPEVHELVADIDGHSVKIVKIY